LIDGESLYAFNHVVILKGCVKIMVYFSQFAPNLRLFDCKIIATFVALLLADYYGDGMH